MRTAGKLTAEELWQMPEPQDGSRVELLQGELIQTPPAGGRHGKSSLAIGAALLSFVRKNGLGKVVSNGTGVVTERDPDTVLAPDVAYWSRERLKELPERFVEVPPDLAVEVSSPSDPQSHVHRKVLDYLDHGVRMVWIVEPKTRTVTVYRSRRDVQILEEDEQLDGGDVLPGFSCRVGEFFS